MKTLLLIFVLSLTGCAKVNYLGEEHSPTENVDLYYDEGAIEKDYDLIGHGLGTGLWVRNKKITSKLIKEAQKRGANAILVTGLGKSNVSLPNGMSKGEKQLHVVFLKYK